MLSDKDRREVDAERAADLPLMSERQGGSAARASAYRIDPISVLGRVRGAERDRRVSMRPAPDCMARLSALLPVKDGDAAYAALRAAEIPIQVNLVITDLSLFGGGDDPGRVQDFGPVPAPWARHMATSPDRSKLGSDGLAAACLRWSAAPSDQAAGPSAA